MKPDEVQGAPRYRGFHKNQIDKDIDYILSLGVEVQYNTGIGEDIKLEDLEKDFDAVFSATGLHLGRSTGVSGSDNERVYQAIELLRKVTDGEEIDVAEKEVFPSRYNY